VGISGCGAGAVPSKQARTSKGLVFGAVGVRCYAGAVRCGFRAVRVLCGCKVLSKG